VSLVVVVLKIYLYYLYLLVYFNLLLGFGLDLRFGGLLVSRKALNILI
jgi:hypothetical protein